MLETAHIFLHCLIQFIDYSNPFNSQDFLKYETLSLYLKSIEISMFVITNSNNVTATVS